MITRKRYREENKLLSSSLLFQSNCSSEGSSNNPAPKRPKRGGELQSFCSSFRMGSQIKVEFRDFVHLLEKACEDESIDVMSDLFWSNFAATWNSIHNQNLDGKTCEVVAKRLRALHTRMESDPQCAQKGAMLQPGLDNIFKKHYDSFSVWDLEQVPETPADQINKGTISAIEVSVSMQKTSTTSSIDPESITAIEVAMKELVDKGYLNYVDLQDAEQYLYTSKLAAITFLGEHDLEKRRDRIKESNKSWQVKSVDMESMRNKRQCR